MKKAVNIVTCSLAVLITHMWFNWGHNDFIVGGIISLLIIPSVIYLLCRQYPEISDDNAGFGDIFVMMVVIVFLSGVNGVLTESFRDLNKLIGVIEGSKEFIYHSCHIFATIVELSLFAIAVSSGLSVSKKRAGGHSNDLAVN